MIASKAEVKNLAFNNNFDIEAVKDNVITLVELEQVKPLLGLDLYNLVVSSPSSYIDLLELLKPFIAYNVKYYINDGNHRKVGNKGVQIATGGNEQPTEVEKAKRDALSFANKYKSQINKHLKDNNLTVLISDDSIINNIIIL